MSYLTQFDRKVTVPEFLLKSPWQDISWGNDAMPSFENRVLGLKVWVDFDDPEDREYPDCPGERFALMEGRMEGDEFIPNDEVTLYTDEEDELERWLLLYQARELVCQAAKVLMSGHLPEEDFADELAELEARLTEQLKRV